MVAAPEGRKSLAPGEARGFEVRRISRVAAKESFAATRLIGLIDCTHGLTAVAMFFRRYAARDS